MKNDFMQCDRLETTKNNSIKSYGFKNPCKLYEEETYRTNFRRQRDRILYTGGFRRLQDKTQVISTMKSGDHRTRLTHTLEVEQIAISLSDALGLNSDLVSAIAIGHDVGHTPFGHAVERVLCEKLESQGGFSHAVQSVRYLTQQMRNSHTPGEVIELQNIIFEGILKHDTDVYLGSFDDRQLDCSVFDLESAGLLEMQVVYWADKIAYLTHDLEDFYKGGIYKNAKESVKDLEIELRGLLANLIPRKGIKSNIGKFETRDLIRNIIANLQTQSMNNLKNNSNCDHNGMKNKTTDRIKQLEDTAVKELNTKRTQNKIELLTTDLSINSIKNIISDTKKIEKELKTALSDATNVEELSGKLISLQADLSAIRKIKKNAYMDGLIINFTDGYRECYKKLREFLDKYYISSPEITRSDAKSDRIARGLFDDFADKKNLLPYSIRELIDDNNSKERIISDYIASMTDRYAELIYSDLNASGGNYKY